MYIHTSYLGPLQAPRDGFPSPRAMEGRPLLNNNKRELACGIAVLKIFCMLPVVYSRGDFRSILDPIY